MGSRYEYEAVGCRIVSEIELPWLVAGGGHVVRDDVPTVTITRGDLPQHTQALSPDFPRIHHDPAVGYEVYGSKNECYWLYDGVASMYIRDGSEIVVDPVESYPPESLHQFVIGPGLRTICVQQGLLVLHASTVVIGSTTVSFAGPSGRGKSTTAAACYAQGHSVLADDLTAVEVREGGAYVLPAYPVFKLEAKSARELGFVPNGTGGWDSRRAVDVSDRFVTEPRQLDIVYLVNDGEAFAAEELPPAERVFALLESSLPLYQESDRDALRKHLTQCSSVAASVQLKRLTRPRARSRLDDLTRFVETDIQQ